MQRNNAKNDAVEGGDDGERPPSSQPIAPAMAGQAPPQPAEKSIAYSAAVEGEASDCEFLFAVLAEKHNAVIRKIREIPPWKWGGEFLELEPQVLRFLGTFAKRYPECAAFRTAYTLASALAVYRLASRKPKTFTGQERADCIAANRDLVDEHSDALLRAYRDIFPFLLKTHGGTAFDATTAIIEAIKAEHERTRHEITKRLLPKSKTRERGGEITQEQVARDFGVSRATVNRWEINQTANGPENKSNKYGYYKELRTNPDLRGAYYELMNCVKRYQAEKRKADMLGIRFVTFVRFHEEWLKHRPYKM